MSSTQDNSTPPPDPIKPEPEQKEDADVTLSSLSLSPSLGIVTETVEIVTGREASTSLYDVTFTSEQVSCAQQLFEQYSSKAGLFAATGASTVDIIYRRELGNSTKATGLSFEQFLHANTHIAKKKYLNTQNIHSIPAAVQHLFNSILIPYTHKPATSEKPPARGKSTTTQPADHTHKQKTAASTTDKKVTAHHTPEVASTASSSTIHTQSKVNWTEYEALLKRFFNEYSHYDVDADNSLPRSTSSASVTGPGAPKKLLDPQFRAFCTNMYLIPSLISSQQLTQFYRELHLSFDLATNFYHMNFVQFQQILSKIAQQGFKQQSTDLAGRVALLIQQINKHQSAQEQQAGA